MQIPNGSSQINNTNYVGYIEQRGQYGWICSKCGKSYAPFVQECYSCNYTTYPIYPTNYPYEPYKITWYNGTDNIGCSKDIGNSTTTIWDGENSTPTTTKCNHPFFLSKMKDDPICAECHLPFPHYVDKERKK